MDTGTLWELAGLFGASLLAATILPGTSEVALIGVLTLGTVSATVAVAVATLGNVIGSISNWVIGRFFASYKNHPRFPLSPEKFERYTEIYQRWGIWTILMSWVPLIGDPLTIVAGVMRAPLPLVIVLVALAKGARYIAVAGGTTWIASFWS